MGFAETVKLNNFFERVSRTTQGSKVITKEIIKRIRGAQGRDVKNNDRNRKR